MPTKRTVLKMGRRDLWFLLLLGFFFANSLVVFFCHHIVTDHHGIINTIVDGTNTATQDVLSLFLESGSSVVGVGHQDGDDELPVFAICLLTRDDLPILEEWIAYHYHSVNLRHLVLAVDPDSSTDPKPILDNFRKHLGKNHRGSTRAPEDKKSQQQQQQKSTFSPLLIEEWHEADFMPEYFVNGEHGKAPNFNALPDGNPDESTWEEYTATNPRYKMERILTDQTLVNNHRFRQTRFLSRCSEHLRDTYAKTNTPVWMSTLDSDEYIVPNPWIMQHHPPSDESILRFEPGSVLRWLVDSKARTKEQRQQQQQQQPPETSNGDGDICLQVPRLLFGAVELSAKTVTPEVFVSDVTHGLVRKDSDNGNIDLVNNLPRHANKMETLRWKFHAAPNDERNFQQKVILDLLNVPRDDELWGDHVHTVHRPSRKLCSPESNTNSDGALLVPTPSSNITASPVMAFHYIGSMERYFSRPNDFRRSKRRYRDRSNITYSRDETGWIDQWLGRFVEDVGIKTASKLLSNYVVDAQQIAK